MRILNLVSIFLLVAVPVKSLACEPGAVEFKQDDVICFSDSSGESRHVLTAADIQKYGTNGSICCEAGMIFDHSAGNCAGITLQFRRVGLRGTQVLVGDASLAEEPFCRGDQNQSNTNQSNGSGTNSPQGNAEANPQTPQCQPPHLNMAWSDGRQMVINPPLTEMPNTAGGTKIICCNGGDIHECGRKFCGDNAAEYFEQGAPLIDLNGHQYEAADWACCTPGSIPANQAQGQTGCVPGQRDDGMVNAQGNPSNNQGWSGPICGNNTVEAGEACDDGNRLNGDGCSADCMVQEYQPHGMDEHSRICSQHPNSYECHCYGRTQGHDALVCRCEWDSNNGQFMSDACIRSQCSGGQAHQNSQMTPYPSSEGPCGCMQGGQIVRDSNICKCYMGDSDACEQHRKFVCEVSNPSHPDCAPPAPLNSSGYSGGGDCSHSTQFSVGCGRGAIRRPSYN